MLNRMIHWSLANRAIILGVSILILVMGVRSGMNLPVEVLPDLTKPTVVILTEAPGLAPEEVEARITQPLESALMGVAGLTRLRTNSDVALSLAYAEFDWDTDIYKARVLVQERLQSARDGLPDGVQPFMTPVASLMGEILLVGVRSTAKEGEPNYLPPREVRSIADWTIKRRLQSIPGIAEILNVGGGINGNQFANALSGPVPSWMEGAGEVEAELRELEEPGAGPTDGADDPQDAATDEALTVGGFGSAHNGGAHVAFGDGSVRFLIDTIDPETLRRLANRADGLLVEGF